MAWITTGVIVWFSCAPLTYAIVFADVQRRYPDSAKENYRTDMGQSVLFSLFGPVSLFVIVCVSGFCEHGLKWK